MPNLLQDLHTVGINPFAVSLVAESLLKSHVATRSATQPLAFFFAVDRNDCLGWAGVQFTLQTVAVDKVPPSLFEFEATPPSADVEAATMKLYEATNGRVGQSYLRAYVWALNEDRAQEMLRNRPGAALERNPPVWNLRLLMTSNEKEFVTAPSDEGWEAKEAVFGERIPDSLANRHAENPEAMSDASRLAMAKIDETWLTRVAYDDLMIDDPWLRDNDRTFHILLLCGGHNVPMQAVMAWTDEQCKQAEDWAGREHLHASDNDDVERIPMPAHVKDWPPKPFRNVDTSDFQF